MALEEAKYRVDKDPSTSEPFIVAMSYRWLEPGHPDRCRHHLQIVAKVLRQYMRQVVSERCANLAEFGLFWDFASLPQVSTCVRLLGSLWAAFKLPGDSALAFIPTCACLTARGHAISHEP